jgi:hypothetical protein
MPQLIGGISGDKKPRDDLVTGVVDQVKPQLLEKVVINNKRPHLSTENQESFNPLVHSYKTQLVAGTNFFVKVSILM